MNTPSRGVDPHYATVTLIRYPGAEGHATGFFFRFSGEDYLITNQHVVDVVDSEGEPLESVRVFTRDDPNDLSNLGFHDLKLRDENGEKTWLTHPDEPQIDIAAIPLEEACQDEIETCPISELGEGNPSTGTFVFTPDDFLPDDVVIGAGEQLMIMGYPIRGTSPYFPLCRNALIASPYGAGLGFATDANMHPGTSGSPVLTIPKAMVQTETGPVIGGRSGPFLIGIHSGDINQFDDPNQLVQSGPLNLNTAWHVELLKDICGN